MELPVFVREVACDDDGEVDGEEVHEEDGEEVQAVLRSCPHPTSSGQIQPSAQLSSHEPGARSTSYPRT